MDVDLLRKCYFYSKTLSKSILSTSERGAGGAYCIEGGQWADGGNVICAEDAARTKEGAKPHAGKVVGVVACVECTGSLTK
jgi:hypothetical protein